MKKKCGFLFLLLLLVSCQNQYTSRTWRLIKGKWEILRLGHPNHKNDEPAIIIGSPYINIYKEKQQLKFEMSFGDGSRTFDCRLTNDSICFLTPPTNIGWGDMQVSPSKDDKKRLRLYQQLDKELIYYDLQKMGRNKKE